MPPPISLPRRHPIPRAPSISSPNREFAEPPLRHPPRLAKPHGLDSARDTRDRGKWKANLKQRDRGRCIHHIPSLSFATRTDVPRETSPLVYNATSKEVRATAKQSRSTPPRVRTSRCTRILLVMRKGAPAHPEFCPEPVEGEGRGVSVVIVRTTSCVRESTARPSRREAETRASGKS